jgi:energy-coupling factor transport system ATP-binding protein
MSEYEVDINDVTFSYADQKIALANISLQARAGECLVVLGANGAGKSSLCYLLSGIVPHIFGGSRTGTVSVADHDPWALPLDTTAQYCGVMLQDPEVQLFNPNVFTEMAFGPSNLQVPREEIINRIKESLTLLHLDGLEKRDPRDLSGGQKQRVALGSVLTMQPRVLVLDEPTSQLDPIGRWEVAEAIRALKSTRRTTIILTTHETDDILDLADQVVVLDEGRIVLYGSPAEVFSQQDILVKSGVRVPILLDILDRINQKIGQKSVWTGSQLQQIDATKVSDTIQELVVQGILEICNQDTHEQNKGDKTRKPMLEADHLTYQYPGQPPVLALRDINLSIGQGEIVGIIGQNGSGKSTLVKTFVGLLRPTKGQVRVNGSDISKISVGQMSQQVGLVLQNPDYQLFTSSCREEILFGLTNIGIKGSAADDKLLEVLQWVNLEKELETFPFRMSFGDRRKLAVAATVALDPQVLILDEPTTAQDHRGRYQIADIGRRFRDEKGRTVLMITHDMDLIAYYAERLIVMWHGQVLLDGPTSEVFQQIDTLGKTFLHPPIATQIARILQPLGFPRNVTKVEDLLSVLNQKSGGSIQKGLSG